MTGSVLAPPLVSAITIFHNGGHFLEEAIESVLAQSYPSWELLLVDDGSTDGASDLAREFATTHPDRIRYLHHDGHRNRGMSASRNLGLQAARGAFVTFLDGDDVWLPGKLARQVDILLAHPAADMTSGATRIWFGWTGRPADAARDSVREIQGELEGQFVAPEMLRRFLRDQALTPATCSVLIRREAIARTGGFEERFTGLYEDQAFFIKAYHKLSCVVTRDTDDLYRQHPGSHMAAASQSGRYSAIGPSRSLVDLHAWCALYFLREGVTDRLLWGALLAKLRGVTGTLIINALRRRLPGRRKGPR